MVDRTWLKKAEQYWEVSEELVEPHWRLKGVVRKCLELFVYGSFKDAEEFAQLGNIIQEAQFDRWVLGRKGRAHGSLLSRWTGRDAHKEIRQARQGSVSYDSEEKAKESIEKMKTKVDAVKKLEKRVAEGEGSQTVKLDGN